MDSKILERMKRIEELMAKGAKATDAEKAEVKKLLAEQMEWSKKNPAEAMEAQKAFEITKKTPEAMKTEFEAARATAKDVKFDPAASTAFREKASAAGVPESILPKPVTPPSKLTPAQEQLRTDYGKSVREKAIAEGKPVAVADADALEAYNSWHPEMAVGPDAAPDPSIEYPMAAAETPAPAATPAAAPVAPKAEAPVAPKAEAPTPEVSNAVNVEASAIAAEKKPGWKDKIKELGTKYGVPMLEIFQAIAHQRSGAGGDTILDKKYQEKLEAKQKEYMENLEKKREEREAAQYEKRIADERAWQEQQAIANRTADVAARREELSSREKLLQMQLAGQKGAAAAGGASIIPQ